MVHTSLVIISAAFSIKILVALDTEEACESLFQASLELAQQTGAKLVLLGVLSPSGDRSRHCRPSHSEDRRCRQGDLSENVDEAAWVKEIFPDCKGYLDVYDRTGLVKARSSFAHGVQLTEREFQRLVFGDPWRH